jgi:tRNA-2-methylthio-N6-dimethylallyladenosine synthase
MRRSYRQERYLGIIARVRTAMPEAAITTDIIVGFPGETDADFEQTLHVVREARFAGAFTFQYSKRPGTPAATMADQVPADVVRERYERLVALQDEIAWEQNKRLVGRTVELLVSEGEGRKDEVRRRLSGRAPDNRLVHFSVGPDAPSPSFEPGRPERPVRPGDLVTVRLSYAAPHYLLADSPDGGSAVLELRRTRAGDAWAARQHSDAEAGAGAAEGAAPRPVSLGMPAFGGPVSSQAGEGACAC